MVLGKRSQMESAAYVPYPKRVRGYKKVVRRARIPVQRLPSGEKKFFDTAFAETIVASTGAITNLSLNLIPQGVTESTRIGRKCTVKSVHLHGEFKFPNSAVAGSTADRMRLIVYQDKQANGATATVADILDSTVGTVIDSFRNLSETGRISILHEQSCDLSAQSGGAPNGVENFGEVKKTFKINKVLNMPLEFSAGTGAIAEIRSNNIGVLAVTEAGLMTLQYTARVRFSDQ